MGKEKFSAKLDSMFTYAPSDSAGLPIFSTGMKGQYVHGNEPSHHVIYLFNRVGKPHKTQEQAAKVMHELYRNSPDGLCGNEDCGQMSAWYIFSAMGFYPVDPASGEYELGTPLFPEVRLHLDNGNTFTIKAPGVSRHNYLVKGVYINGKPQQGTSIKHTDIMNGGTLEFDMSK